MHMVRGLGFSLAFTVVAVLVLGYTRALANGGALSGYEPFAIAILGILSGAIFFLAVRGAAMSTAKLIAGVVTATLAFPALAFFGPLAFCVLFMPNTSCM